MIQLAYDFVKDLSGKGVFGWEPGGFGPGLDQSANLLGALVEFARKGQYPSLPHHLTCPVLNYRGHDYCPFGPVCRFVQHPGAVVAPGDGAEEESA
jgi:hypothetical protein